MKSQLAISIRRIFQTTVLLCTLLFVGCKAFSTKSNTIQCLLGDSEANRIAVRECVDSVAREFDFKRHSNGTLSDDNYLTRHTATNRYSLSAYVHRDRWQFSAADIINFESLALKLKQPQRLDAVSQYLTEGLSPATRDLLSNYAGGPDLEVEKAVLRDLNSIIGGAITRPRDGIIYSSQRFANVKLASDTMALLNQKEKLYCDIVQLNEMLLIDAYPSEIKKASRTNHIGLLFIHLSRDGKKTERYKEIESRLTAQLHETFGTNVQIKSRRGWIP